MTSEPAEIDGLLDRLRAGDTAALGTLWGYYRPRLQRFVRLRMDNRMATRVDPSDVLQEAYLDAQRQVPAYLRDARVAPFVWLRRLVEERLANTHRHHLGAKCRTARREISLPKDASVALGSRLLAAGPNPSARMRQEECCRRVQQALEKLRPDDREVILMRHFEEMSNQEVAQALGLTESGATMRYGRALVRLKEILLAESGSWRTGP